MITESMLEKLMERYSHVHPLIFQRSVEKAKSDVDLFDILDSIPNNYPIVWDEEKRSWKTTEDMLQSKHLSFL